MSPAGRPARRRLGFESRLLIQALLIGVPGGVVALAFLWTGDFSPKVRWTLTAFVVLLWWGLAAQLRTRVIHPIQTLSNLLAALREGRQDRICCCSCFFSIPRADHDIVSRQRKTNRKTLALRSCAAY